MKKCLIFLTFLSALLPGAVHPDGDILNNQIGYVLPESDSTGTPIFIDGVYIGKTPITQPIPIENGIHEISYLPPNFEIPSIKDRLPEAVKRVYIPANDTVNVVLIYDIHRAEFKRIRQEQVVTYITGFSITCVVLYLMWMI